jgi:pyruvate/2-oxoglutarate/acetoin dehydrogenase E1 component
MRKLKYCEAIREAQFQAMERDSRVYLIGQGVDNPWCVGSTTKDLLKIFGDKRVRDVPISENGMTGAAIGSAMAGLRPVVFHPRLDFMYLALDQIINHGAIWNYMFCNQVHVPVVIRGIINRGGEQAAQHSQSPYSMYAHVPGLKVVLPSTPYDAKGLMLAAIEDNNPVMYFDDRWLYNLEEEVPEEYYTIPLGKAAIRCEGTDVTIVGISYLSNEAVLAADELSKIGVSAEVIDPRSIKPLDMDLINQSVQKTKRLIIADPAWPMCGAAKEIAANVYRDLYKNMLKPIEIISLPDAPAPASRSLEKIYYPRKADIVAKALNIVK